MLEHLHPKLVHFPIALFLSAGMLSVLNLIFRKEPFYQAARYVFNLAAFFSVSSVVSGFIEVDRLQLKHPVLTAHRFYAMALTIVSCIFIIVDRFMPKRFKRPVFLGMVLVCAVLVILTGHLGGQMVYDYGVGVPH